MVEHFLLVLFVGAEDARLFFEGVSHFEVDGGDVEQDQHVFAEVDVFASVLGGLIGVVVDVLQQLLLVRNVHRCQFLLEDFPEELGLEFGV